MVESVTEEELAVLKEESVAEGLNYFQTDTDLIERFSQNLESVSGARIIVPISE